MADLLETLIFLAISVGIYATLCERPEQNKIKYNPNNKIIIQTNPSYQTNNAQYSNRMSETNLNRKSLDKLLE